jgi:UDP-glucose 4-epimerase
MKCLIVGADGFVGKNLTERRLFEYLKFDNGFLKGTLEADTIYLDITSDLNALETILKNFNEEFVIVNLAAIHHIPYCNKNPAEAMLTNVYGNLKLFELAARYNCKHFIFASSGAVYKPKEGRHIETDEIESSDVYSATKILAEAQLKKSSEDFDVKITVLRFFNIVGKYDYTPHLIPDIVDQILDKELTKIRLGNLTTIRDYIHVDTICDVLEKFIESKPTYHIEEFNVGTGNGRNGVQIFDEIKNIAKSNKERIEDKSRLRRSDRPSQLANPNKLRRQISLKSEGTLIDAMRAYFNWRLS